MSNQIDEWINTLINCKYLSEQDLKKLCEIVKNELLNEPNVLNIPSPVTICGDIHGQFYDLLELFKTGGEPKETNYIFLGDFVDRGYNSLETFSLLMALKAKYPRNIALLRGNHESKQITQVYGFYDECQQKYGNSNAWKNCTKVFDYLSIAAVINDSVFCVHGGLSPDIYTIDDIRLIDRKREIPQIGEFCDLMWSDPDDVETWQISPRGAGWLFGSKVAFEFLQVNNLQFMTRAHQLVNEGYKQMFKKKVVTVWSAPNYCYRCGNIAALLHLDKDLTRKFKIFESSPHSIRPPGNDPLPYFL